MATQPVARPNRQLSETATQPRVKPNRQLKKITAQPMAEPSQQLNETVTQPTTKPARRLKKAATPKRAPRQKISRQRQNTPLVRGVQPQIQPPPPTTPTAVPVQQTNTTPKELASHETEFNKKEEGRSTNISLAAQSINGKVVQPGETFSFNETVGPTIERRGYKKGVIYIQGEKSEGFGGGVCQVSTTLHNAATEAGMTILERHDHSLPVGYAKSGEEAATSFGGIDFKFKNDKPYPVIIKSSTNDGKLIVSIHSV